MYLLWLTVGAYTTLSNYKADGRMHVVPKSYVVFGYLASIQFSTILRCIGMVKVAGLSHSSLAYSP